MTMIQVQSITHNLRLTVLGLLVLSSAVGCHQGKGGLSCLKKEKGCEEVMGVDDVANHGHKKTCWRSWDDPAWQAQCCPVYVTSSPAPTHFPGMAPPVPNADELPPKSDVAPPADVTPLMDETPPADILPQTEDLRAIE